MASLLRAIPGEFEGTPLQRFRVGFADDAAPPLPASVDVNERKIQVELKSSIPELGHGLD